MTNTTRENLMFGCSVETLEENWKAALEWNSRYPEMIAMSYLSDVQERLAHGDLDNKEDLRKQLNIAKFFMSRAMDLRLSKETS